jgi:putative transposase
MRYLFSDADWLRFQPMVDESKVFRCGKKPTLPDRLFFEAVLYLDRTGIPWRDLPGDFGRWEAVYMRYRRWVDSGSLKRLFERLTANPEFGEVRRVFLDSTIVRAHQHAAGAPRKKTMPSPRPALRVWAAVAAGIPAKSC